MGVSDNIGTKALVPAASAAPVTVGTGSLERAELEQLRRARYRLEHPGLAARIGAAAGAPIEKGFDLLPRRWTARVDEAARRSITKALDIALGTLAVDERRPASRRWHSIAATATGATGGAFGFAALAVELPISTIIMLRSIADIARSEGEDLSTPEARLQCLQVLALGGRSRLDDASETGYFAARAALARAVSEAATHVARRGMADKSAPALVRLVSLVAARFSVVVSEKAAAQALPIIGAIGGGTLNAVFIDHFQEMARGHFVIRRLERAHGADLVGSTYAGLALEAYRPPRRRMRA